MRPAQIEAVRHSSPIAYLPWGALEYHSHHNPIGLDGIKARGICTELAKRTGGVVLPPVYLGTETMKTFKHFGHSLEHGAATVATVCRELLTELAHEKFRVIALLTGHGGLGHVRILEETAAQVAAGNPQLRVWVLPDYRATEPRWGPDHAALGETSYQLLFDPGLVDLTLVPADHEPTLSEDGIWGENPAAATAAEGQARLDLLLSVCVPRILELLAETAA